MTAADRSAHPHRLARAKCYLEAEKASQAVSFAVNSFSNAIETGFCILFVQPTAIFAFNSFSK